MTTIALIGPDGSGKTTVANRLVATLEGDGIPAAYLYMGVNPDASTRQLPTTRLIWALRRRRGNRPDAGPPPAPGGNRTDAGDLRGAARIRRELKATLHVTNLVAEEIYRTMAVRREERQGKVVVYDRHYFLDYHAHDIVPRPGRLVARTAHGWFLRRVLPRPDLVVALDAPAEELLRRKGEGSIEALERRQADYERAFADLRVARVDATQPLPAVVEDVQRIVVEFSRVPS